MGVCSTLPNADPGPPPQIQTPPSLQRQSPLPKNADPPFPSGQNDSHVKTFPFLKPRLRAVTRKLSLYK